MFNNPKTIERLGLLSQPLLRYDIIKKGLLKISKEELSSAQETTLEELDEMFGVVKQLTCGEAVADLIAYAFLDDMELNWEFSVK